MQHGARMHAGCLEKRRRTKSIFFYVNLDILWPKSRYTERVAMIAMKSDKTQNGNNDIFAVVVVVVKRELSNHHHDENEFASFQTLSRPFGLAQFVKCRRVFPELNSLRTLSRFKKRDENSSSNVNVFCKTSHWEV